MGVCCFKSVYVSNPVDTLNNLKASLQQSVTWETQVCIIKDLVKEQKTSAPIANQDLYRFEMDECRRVKYLSEQTMFGNRSEQKKLKLLKALNKNAVGKNTQNALGESASQLFGQATQTAYGSMGNKESKTEINEYASLSHDYSDKTWIITKYLFVDSFIRKWVKNAQLCYELFLKLNIYNSEISNGAKSLSAQHMNEKRNKRDKLSLLLTEALANYDRAHETIVWIKIDWYLSFALFKIQTQINRMKQLFISSDSSNDSTQIEVQEMIIDLIETKLLLQTSIHQNDRLVLNLGFNYLDHSKSGVLQLDSLNIPNRILIAITKIAQITDNILTIKQIQNAIDHSDSKIENNRMNIKLLKEKISLLKCEPNNKNYQSIVENQNKINQLLSECEDLGNDLFLLVSYFTEIFTNFISLQAVTPQSSSDNYSSAKEILQAQVASIERKKTFDPLDVPPAGANYFTDNTKTHLAENYTTQSPLHNIDPNIIFAQEKLH